MSCTRATGTSSSDRVSATRSWMLWNLRWTPFSNSRARIRLPIGAPGVSCRRASRIACTTELMTSESSWSPACTRSVIRNTTVVGRVARVAFTPARACTLIHLREPPSSVPTPSDRRAEAGAAQPRHVPRKCESRLAAALPPLSDSKPNPTRTPARSAPLRRPPNKHLFGRQTML